MRAVEPEGNAIGAVDSQVFHAAPDNRCSAVSHNTPDLTAENDGALHRGPFASDRRSNHDGILYVAITWQAAVGYEVRTRSKGVRQAQKCSDYIARFVDREKVSECVRECEMIPDIDPVRLAEVED